MYLYNSATRQKERFQPLTPPKVGIYVCGPTVYDRAHIGNARPVVVFDTLFRLLSLTYDVTYVRNITDVDDKIITAAEKNQESFEALTARTTRFFHEDMAALNALPVTVEPHATHHILDMIALIQILLDKGLAYEVDHHVLFETASDPAYGRLAGRSLKDMIAGARVEVAPYKKNPMDFVLWKPSSSSQPGWESPWGRGRPGWHIECSAMCHRYLGETFDIHGGGGDLLFPHHENEQAQNRGAFGDQTFARLWMHNGMLMVEGKKMSKSLGNFLTVEDLLKKYPGEVIRLTLLSTHYRQPLDWTSSSVQQACVTLNKFYRCLEGVPLREAPPDEAVLQALYDDLNTPLALNLLHQRAYEINGTSEVERKALLGSVFKASLNLLGLLFQTPEKWFAVDGNGSLSPEEIQEIVSQRLEARNRKDFQEADRLRAHLESLGILLEDSPQGTTWRKK